MEAVAIHAFKPNEADEMGLEKGTNLYVIEMEEDPNWFKARQGQREGMVPANYISLQPHPWYVPKCSRREAEARLLEVDGQTNTFVQPDGAFILRQSENEHGQFSISVKEGSAILHFRVFSDANCKYHIWNNKFQSINKLIDYHRYQTINGDQTLYLRDCVPSKVFGPCGSGPNTVIHDSRMHTNSRQITSTEKLGSPTSDSTSRVSKEAPLPTYSLPPGITSTHLAGRQCVAKFDFSAEFEGEMSFRRGHRMRLLGEEDDNWWFAELIQTPQDHQQGTRGLIPANYVQLIPDATSTVGPVPSSRAIHSAQHSTRTAH